MGLYNSLGMSAESVCHWEMASLVSEVRLNHAHRRIEISSSCPPDYGFGLGTFNLRELIDIIRMDLGDELSTVQAILAAYPNTAFSHVHSVVSSVDALEVENPRRCLAVWPYLLHKPVSASESVAALAQMVLFATQEPGSFGESRRGYVREMVAQSLRSRPFDYTIRAFQQRVESQLSAMPADAHSGEPLHRCCREFLDSLGRAGLDMAIAAQSHVDSGDALVTYGYSTNVLDVLKEARKRGKYPIVYVVEYYEPAGSIRLATVECERMAGEVRNLDLEVYIVPLTALAHVLRELKDKRIPAKVLIGTHGVTHEDDLLCKVGAYMLVLTARDLGMQIIAFAASMKRVAQEPVGGQEQALEPADRITRYVEHPRLRNVKWPCPVMDVVPHGLVDVLITESGIKVLENAGKPPAGD
jgi:translation initiation factor 2B subunit (eIF-2B alpha/beta/delta family)